MKNLLKINFVIVLTAYVVSAQIENLKTHTQMNLDCKKCHVCDTPTKSNPCLIKCPRNKIEVKRHSPMEGPETIILNKIKNDSDIYGPSTFSHRLHSEMSVMSGGCSICHHFNPPGKIVKCSYCHETARQRTDLSKPDLKAAFHRQCMDCHKTWESESKCENCHLPNSAEQNVMESPKIVKSHEKIEIPVKIVYETESEEGDLVTFFHNDHGSLFGNECSDCHNKESCANCHSQKKIQKLEFDEHEGCSSCHDTENNCNNCHKDEETKPFNHMVKTGFDLRAYHSGLQCISCHIAKNKFSGLNENCISCHKDAEGYFDHGMTGLVLDENHIENECTDCHKLNSYKIKPTCAGCHDDDIVYPDSLPGEEK